jgi:aspartate/methionine/tyrosine aminotransferase
MINFEQYPFEKLNKLLEGVTPSPKHSPISLTIGEPQFQTPQFIQDALAEHTNLLNKYPKSVGESYLKEAIAAFVSERFHIDLKDEQFIPTFGTREVLFNFPQFLLFDKEKPKMAFTNPFYQIYEGSAIASRAEVLYLNLTKENGFKPQISDALHDVDLVIINSPNNPTASVMSPEELRAWAKASIEYDFVLINDECYSEIYTSTPPPCSLLRASLDIGNSNFTNILVLNSVSKRSSAPSLRSGFIAGDADILKDYMLYRTYVGAASPLPLQQASAIAWAEQTHVAQAREKYAKNFELAKEILGVEIPEATFYIWLEVEDDIEFTKKLYEEYNVKVLAGRFLGRAGVGKGYVRIALVYDEATTKEALLRIKDALRRE